MRMVKDNRTQSWQVPPPPAQWCLLQDPRQACFSLQKLVEILSRTCHDPPRAETLRQHNIEYRANLALNKRVSAIKCVSLRDIERKKAAMQYKLNATVYSRTTHQ